MYKSSRAFAPTSLGRSALEAQPAQDKKNATPAIVALILAVIVNLIVFANVDFPIVRPMLGFWFVIAFPAYLLFTTTVWRGCSLAERVGYSVGAVLLVLMLTGLAINEVLPTVGVNRPLDADPILIASDMINLLLFAARCRYPDRLGVRVALKKFSRKEVRLLVAASLTVVLSVVGAIRLNNGESGRAALVALISAALVAIFSVRWLKFTRESVMLAVIYLVSFGLLLSTSLRGWYITGHDIQQEYQVFQLTEAHGSWSMSFDRSAYYACLSITMLPTELGRMINVNDPYVYKIFFQALFALCPTLAYGIARRYFNRGISTLAVAYFVGFPTFFTDMPFLNRQEIGLLFVACGVLAATNPAWSWRRRQVSLGIAGLGVEVSHYSTMYVFAGVLGIALLFSYANRVFAGIRLGSSPHRDGLARGNGLRASELENTVTLGLLGIFAIIIFTWGTLVTNTTGQVLTAGNTAISSISSGAISFKLNSAPATTPDEAIQKLRQQSLKSRANQEDIYLPVSAVSEASTPTVTQVLNPLTEVGRAASSIGFPVVGFNAFVRNFVAYGEQFFLGIGLLRLVISRRRGRYLIGRQFLSLVIGSIGMIAIITVLPSISADYGPLRAFQQGLLFFSPIIVIGSMTIFEPIGAVRARVSSCWLCVGIFLATSTVVPQILGGNLAELNLNNNGIYYDLYYTTTRDVSAVAWLSDQSDVQEYPVQATYSQQRFLFTSQKSVSGSEEIGDAYPTLALLNSWLIIASPEHGASNAYTYTPANGAITEYKYPTSILNRYKNLVYTNGATAIYK